MSSSDKQDYILQNIKKCEQKAIDYNKPLEKKAID
jgi:hypothetical protein